MQKINFTNFLVLEAKDYIGGRVKSVPFGGETVPLGAGWIHNAKAGHVYYELAKKYNMSLYKDNYTDTLFRYVTLLLKT